MNTIHSSPQWLGKYYGIELEIEAEGLYSVEEEYNPETEEYVNHDPCVPRGWLREQEDSICGVELISDRPYYLSESIENINRVFADIERMGFKPIRTPRGSTHVHANIADLTWEQLKYFITACAWAEPTLIELAGKGRKGNLFAQSYETAPVGWWPALEWVRRKSIFQNCDTHYMATSFFPLSYLGSVEFRMGPSARNSEDAIRWLQYIDTVVDAGRFLNITASEEPEFLSRLMSKFDDKKREQLRKKGARNAAEVWDIMSEPYVAPEPRVRGKKKTLVSDFEEALSLQSLMYNPGQSLGELMMQPTPGLQAPPPMTTQPDSPVNGYESCGDPACVVCNPNVIAPPPTTYTYNINPAS